MRINTLVGLADLAVAKRASARFALSACVLMGTCRTLPADPLRPALKPGAFVTGHSTGTS